MNLHIREKATWNEGRTKQNEVWKHGALAQAADNTAFALEISGETLRHKEGGDKSTHEDPGLAVGGGPEEMREKQRKLSGWVTGPWAWVQENHCRLKGSSLLK